MKKIIILLFLFCSTAHAEEVVKYDLITSDVISCRSIGDSSVWLNDVSDYLSVKDGFLYIESGCSSLPQVRYDFLQVVGGAVVEKSNAEKQAILDQEAADQDLSLRTSSKQLFDGQGDIQLALRAFAKLTLDEINILRAQHALAPRTLAQVKTAIQNSIDNGDVDE